MSPILAPELDRRPCPHLGIAQICPYSRVPPPICLCCTESAKGRGKSEGDEEGKSGKREEDGEKGSGFVPSSAPDRECYHHPCSHQSHRVACKHSHHAASHHNHHATHHHSHRAALWHYAHHRDHCIAPWPHTCHYGHRATTQHVAMRPRATTPSCHHGEEALGERKGALGEREGGRHERERERPEGGSGA